MKEKTYIFWISLSVLYFLSITNTILLYSIFRSIQLDKSPENVDVLSQTGFVKFDKNTEFPTIYKDDGKISGFQDEPVEINSYDREFLEIYIKDKEDISHLRFKMSEDEISFDGLKRFQVVDIDEQRMVFNTDITDIRLPDDLLFLDTKELKTAHVISPEDYNLTIKSDQVTRIYGNEGIRLYGNDIIAHADGDIFFDNVDGNMNILTKDFRLNFEKIPIIVIDPNYPYLPELQYKLCVCMPLGKLFLVRVLRDQEPKLACSYINVTSPDSPCFA